MPWLSCGGSQEDGKQVWVEDLEVHPKPAPVLTAEGQTIGSWGIRWVPPAAISKAGCVVSAPSAGRCGVPVCTRGSSVTLKEDQRPSQKDRVKRRQTSQKPTFFLDEKSTVGCDNYWSFTQVEEQVRYHSNQIDDSKPAINAGYVYYKLVTTAGCDYTSQLLQVEG